MADTKQYWLNVAKDAGLSEDQTKALEVVVANDKFANAFVPRPEYSRSLDAETQKYRDLVAQNEAYYRTEAQRAADNQNKVNEALTQAQRYRDLYGELEPGATNRTVQTPAFDESKYIARDKYDADLKRIEGQSLFVIKEGLKASQDYMTRFKKPLDIDALEKFAVEKGLPINQAYRDFVAPELEAQQKLSFSEELAKARAEGAADALSRANVPIDTRSREASPFLANALKPVVKDAASMSESERANSFADAWNQAGTAKS